MSKHSARNENEKTKSAEIGRRLQDLRLEYGKKVNKPNIRQGDFGELLGIGGDTQGSRDTLVGRLERGECDIKPSELQKYSQLCGVSIDYIVNGGEYTREETLPEFTFNDLCKLIVDLDNCGLIDIVSSGAQGFKFRDIEPPQPIYIAEQDRYLDPLPESDTQEKVRYIADSLRKFIIGYNAAKQLVNDRRLARNEWLAEKGIEGALKDFEMEAAALLYPSVAKLTKEVVEDRKLYESLPFN